MTPYSLTDIGQYLRGDLSPAGMHAIEKAALQDPFLADAIEGYRSAGIVTANEDLSSIHDQLHITKETTVVTGRSVAIKSIAWLQVAASVILVAGATILGWVFLKNDTKEKKAVQTVAGSSKKDTVEKDIVAVLRKNESAKAKSIFPAPEAEITALSSVKGYDTIVKRFEVQEYRVKRLASPNTINPDTSSFSIYVTVPVPQKITSDEIAKINRDDSLWKMQNDSLRLSRGLLARIPGIQVDKNGKITTPGQTVQKVLVDGEEFFGDYKNALFLADKKDTGHLSALNEVVIVGYGTNRKKDLPLSFKPMASKTKTTTISNDSISIYFPPAINAHVSASSVKNTPVIGWREFNRYLSEKLSLIQSDIKAPYDSIAVMVNIDKSGKILYAGVTRSFNNSLNSSVSKAILEGPRWINVSGRNENFSLVIAVYR